MAPLDSLAGKWNIKCKELPELNTRLELPKLKRCPLLTCYSVLRLRDFYYYFIRYFYLSNMCESKKVIRIIFKYKLKNAEICNSE